MLKRTAARSKATVFWVQGTPVRESYLRGRVGVIYIELL